MGELALTKAVRGSILHFLGDPSKKANAYEYLSDGVLVFHRGKITQLGPAEKILAELPENTPLTHYKAALILPGFVDAHTHYPQTEMIASRGKDLLDWLNNYTFPVERKFCSYSHCKNVAQFFLQQLLRNGTTSALVVPTVHKVSVQAMFEEALNLKMRLITGKVLMDQNAPSDLLDDPETGYADSESLLQEWHGKGRLHYAITPRFAATSSHNQFKATERLRREFQDVHLHTHLSENQEEVAWISRLFPDRRSYLDVYDEYNLLGPKSIFAHAIYVTDSELDRIAETDSAISFCPTSNLFLGSGLFDVESVTQRNIRFGLGTDVGAGTSFSILRALSEGYKIAQLQKYTLDPFRSFYLATLGGANTLSIDKYVGNFEVGKEADIVVLDTKSPTLLGNRFTSCETLEEKLLVLMTLGDDRNVRATYVMGNPLYERDRD